MSNDGPEIHNADARKAIYDRLPPPVVIQFVIIEKIFTTIWLLVRSCFWIVIAYIGYLAIKELAGQQTVASFIFEFFTGNGKAEGYGDRVWIIVSFLLLVWAKSERWLRLRKVSSMSGRINELEKYFDPNRTSSGLMKTGETPLDERGP